MEMVAQGFEHLLNSGDIQLVGNDELGACQGASAIVILTEWDAFKAYDYGTLTNVMAPGPRTLYDLRKILTLESIEAFPFDEVFQLGVGWLRRGTD